MYLFLPHRSKSISCWLYAGLLFLAATLFAQSEAGTSPADVSPDAWFPRTRTSDKGSIVLYAPQIQSWDHFDSLTAYMAFQIEVTGTGRSPFGTANFTARTAVDLSKREVLLYDLTFNELIIPGIYPFEAEYSVLRNALKGKTSKVPLDLILEYLPEDLPVVATPGLGTEPPPIFVSTGPAILLSIDAKPIFIPAGESGLEFVLNASWTLFREKEGTLFYLHGPAGWLTAGRFEGPWNWANSLPAAFAKLPEDPNWEEARANLPVDLTHIEVSDTAPAKVFTSWEPAELILFDGDPRWESIGDTGIDEAANSASEIYRHGEQFYFLSAGRWFRSPLLEREWILQSQLPEAFQTIPVDHPKGYIRSSIPGTREAWEAAIVATIPLSAKFERRAAADLAPEVTYAGEPVFIPIEGTGIEQAISTSYQVLKYGGWYYLCYNATWFTSVNPDGPWVFADSIPDEFAKIPPASPVHNTSYVTVAESDDNSVAYSSTAGYTNSYVSESGTVVNGSGFVQSAVTVWVGYEILDNADYYYRYPYPYYPWPPTYGYGSWYNPNTGRYGETVVGYGPFGAARSTAVYNPQTGVYGRGQAVWDSDELAGRGYAYNPNTNTSRSRRGYYDFDDKEGWSQRVTRRGDEWLYAETEWNDGRMTTKLESSRGGQGAVAREREGDQSTGSGSFQTGNGRQVDTEFSREKQGDTLVTDRTLSGESRSAQISGTVEDGQGVFQVSGSEGGSGTVTRELEDGQLTGSGSFSKGGKTIESDTTRSAEGVRRDFESSEGGQAVTGRQGENRGFVGQTGSGDVYAGHNGEVYKKSDSGWEQVDPAANAATHAQQSSAASRSSTERSRVNTASESPFNNRVSAQSGTAGYQQLERDHLSRQRGYNRYESFQKSRSAGSSRNTPAGRRR